MQRRDYSHGGEYIDPRLLGNDSKSASSEFAGVSHAHIYLANMDIEHVRQQQILTAQRAIDQGLPTSAPPQPLAIPNTFPQGPISVQYQQHSGIAGSDEHSGQQGLAGPQQLPTTTTYPNPYFHSSPHGLPLHWDPRSPCYLSPDLVWGNQQAMDPRSGIPDPPDFELFEGLLNTLEMELAVDSPQQSSSNHHDLVSRGHGHNNYNANAPNSITYSDTFTQRQCTYGQQFSGVLSQQNAFALGRQHPQSSYDYSVAPPDQAVQQQPTHQYSATPPDQQVQQLPHQWSASPPTTGQGSGSMLSPTPEPTSARPAVKRGRGNATSAGRGKRHCQDCVKGFVVGSDLRCRRCNDKYQRSTAPTAVFNLDADVSDFAEARARIFAPVQAMAPYDFSVEEVAQNEDVHVRRLLDAVNHPLVVNGAWMGRQQRLLNENCKMDPSYSSAMVTARLRFLFACVVAYHRGRAEGVYATGGDNKGYAEDRTLTIYARLNSIVTWLEMNKRVVMDVIEGRGVMAFAMNPEAYHKRKMANDDCNVKKKGIMDKGKAADPEAPLADGEKKKRNRRPKTTFDPTPDPTDHGSEQAYQNDRSDDDYVPYPDRKAPKRLRSDTTRDTGTQLHQISTQPPRESTENVSGMSMTAPIAKDGGAEAGPGDTGARVHSDAMFDDSLDAEFELDESFIDPNEARRTGYRAYPQG